MNLTSSSATVLPFPDAGRDIEGLPMFKLSSITAEHILRLVDGIHPLFYELRLKMRILDIERVTFDGGFLCVENATARIHVRIGK